MAITINTNISSLIAQRNLNAATNALNTSIERMTTGYKINHAKDNAAGHSIANLWKTQLGSLDVAADNAATGSDLLTTAEETYSLLTSHLQRIRDLTEQSANGTYGSASLKAIQAEIYARLEEISRISANSEFNGIKLMAYERNGDGSGITDAGINLQVGLYANDNSRIKLDVSLFKNASVSGLFNGLMGTSTEGGKSLSEILEAASKNAFETGKLNSDTGLQAFASACSGLIYDTATKEFTLQATPAFGAQQMLKILDSAISDISNRVTKIGASQNKVASAVEALEVQSRNITSSLSTLRDTDIAEESSNYIQAQILQQASSTLLSTANQLPSIALNLI